MDKVICLIDNMGCDDETTQLFELDEEQYKFLRNIFNVLNAQSSYICMPKIFIIKATNQVPMNYHRTEKDFNYRIDIYNGKKYRFDMSTIGSDNEN